MSEHSTGRLIPSRKPRIYRVWQELTSQLSAVSAESSVTTTMSPHFTRTLASRQRRGYPLGLHEGKRLVRKPPCSTRQEDRTLWERSVSNVKTTRNFSEQGVDTDRQKDPQQPHTGVTNRTQIS